MQELLESKCIKCNGSHKMEYYYYFVWCCKANFKANPPRLETKQGKSYSHLFKCLKYKRNHQADSNQCLF